MRGPRKAKGAPMDGFYRFPEIAHPSEKNPCRTPFEQTQKVIEEAIEAFEEAKRADRDAMLVELLDTIHAVETALRRNYAPEEVEAGRLRVIEKNKARGFYEEG